MSYFRVLTAPKRSAIRATVVRNNCECRHGVKLFIEEKYQVNLEILLRFH